MKVHLSVASLLVASADFGKDTYAMSHPFAFKAFMEEYFPTAENMVQANNTDSCVEWVKLCIDDGHMSACSGPQGNFQIHSVGAYKRDAGVKSLEQFETEFTQSMGDMSKYDPFFENHMGMLTPDLDYYINAFNSGGVPYFASTFTDAATNTKYKSVLVQIPGSLAPEAKSLLNLEILSTTSSLFEASNDVYHHQIPRASSASLVNAHNHLESAPRQFSSDGKPVLVKLHRSFASSDLSRDSQYFQSALQGNIQCDGSVCEGKMQQTDTTEFRYVAASSTQGPTSVADYESYQVNLHNTCFNSEANDGFDRLADNHFGHNLGGGALDAYIKGQKSFGLPYRFYGGGGSGGGVSQFFYMYAPNGWGAQVIGSCTDSSLCPSRTGGYNMCTQGIKGHCDTDSSSVLV